MPRPQRQAALNAKPVVGKKRARNAAVAQDARRVFRVTAKQQKAVLVRCSAELTGIYPFLNRWLRDNPDYEKDCTQKEWKQLQKSLTAITRASGRVHDALCDAIYALDVLGQEK